MQIIIFFLAYFHRTLVYTSSQTPFSGTTVKPPNKGHIGDGPFVPCREVVLFSKVFYWKILKGK